MAFYGVLSDYFEFWTKSTAWPKSISFLIGDTCFEASFDYGENFDVGDSLYCFLGDSEKALLLLSLREKNLLIFGLLGAGLSMPFMLLRLEEAWLVALL